jgi:hypothetical protein
LQSWNSYVLFRCSAFLHAVRMASLHQKIAAERNARAMLDDHGLLQPDDVEYGETCVRLFFREERVMLIVQIDQPPPGWVFAEDLSQEELERLVSEEE